LDICPASARLEPPNLQTFIFFFPLLFDFRMGGNYTTTTGITDTKRGKNGTVADLSIREALSMNYEQSLSLRIQV
jgi:hypothetical protein